MCVCVCVRVCVCACVRVCACVCVCERDPATTRLLYEPHMQGDTACHWDCVQRSYQWHGKRGLIILLYLQQVKTRLAKSQAPEMARLEQEFFAYNICTSDGCE